VKWKSETTRGKYERNGQKNDMRENQKYQFPENKKRLEEFKRYK
jgi:hypothetical protein